MAQVSVWPATGSVLKAYCRKQYEAEKVDTDSMVSAAPGADTSLTTRSQVAERRIRASSFPLGPPVPGISKNYLASVLVKKFGQEQRPGWTNAGQDGEADPTAGSSVQAMIKRQDQKRKEAYDKAVRRMGEKENSGEKTFETRGESANPESSQVVDLALMS